MENNKFEFLEMIHRTTSLARDTVTTLDILIERDQNIIHLPVDVAEQIKQLILLQSRCVTGLNEMLSVLEDRLDDLLERIRNPRT